MKIYITGILTLIIYFPIFLFMIRGNFRKKFSKINSRGLDILVEIMIGILYFLVILFSFFKPIVIGKISVLGILVYFAGLALTYSGYYIFYKETGLITKNVYAISRNPTYFFGFVAIFGIVLMTLSWEIFVMLILLLVLTDRIVKNEEKFLKEKFGKKYLEYRERVRRWI
ncbi:MAG: isoprenylcysteine carboxylmethyltransferase family protein [Candidatus Pacearchaeota archaeon]